MALTCAYMGEARGAPGSLLVRPGRFPGGGVSWSLQGVVRGGARLCSLDGRATVLVELIDQTAARREVAFRYGIDGVAVSVLVHIVEASQSREPDMAHGQIDVRPCTAADLDLLTKQWHLRDAGHESHVARSVDGASEYLVAWSGDLPLGSVVLRWDGYVGPEAQAAHPDAIEICHLQVRPGNRGRGVGTQLLQVAEDLVLARGLDLVAVGVGDDNPDAQRLYERLGYRATGVFDISEYDWTADDGTVHRAKERDQMLLKTLHRRGRTGG